MSTVPMRLLPILLWILFPLTSVAQEPADSVFIVARANLHDSVKAKKINGLFYKMLVAGKYDEMIRVTDSLRSLSGNKKLPYCEALSYYTKGRVLNEKGNYPHSRENLLAALKIYEKIGDKTGIANSYNGIGQIYLEQGNNTEALKYYFSSLTILTEAGDKPGISTAYNNIGNLFMTQGNRPEALKNYNESLRIREEANDRQGMAASLNNIGNVYYGEKNYVKALEYFRKALAINKEFGRKRWISNNYLGIGSVYEQLKDYTQALENYNAALSLKREIGDKNGIAAAYTSVGDVFSAQKDFVRAKMYLDSSLSIAIEIGNIGMIKDTYNSLMRLSYSRGDYKKAYEYYELFSKAKDSLINQENLKATAMMQSQFDLERKDNEIKLLNKENEVRSERALAESRKQQIIIWSVIGILLVVGLFSLLIYNRWKLTSNQKQIIEKQQKSILDSIRYAQHIQKTVIPGEEEVRNILPFESFVLFQPKDIVSGDFYWVSSVKNNGSEKYVVAAGDCTGHGVPGAFLTMMGSMLLKEVIGKNILEPAEILTHIHHGVTATLSRGKEKDAAGDGMDIAVCVIDQTARTVSYAGAMLSAYVFSPEKNKIEVLKADSVSIGGLYSGAEEISFHQHTIPLEHNACLYLFSDGYADQFSKETKARFGTKRFRELLEKNALLPMSAQKEILLNTLNEWKGDRTQLDDVLLMGIRL